MVLFVQFISPSLPEESLQRCFGKYVFRKKKKKKGMGDLTCLFLWKRLCKFTCENVTFFTWRECEDMFTGISIRPKIRCLLSVCV